MTEQLAPVAPPERRAWKEALIWSGVVLVALIVLFVGTILSVPITLLWMAYRIVTWPLRLARGWLRGSAGA